MLCPNRSDPRYKDLVAKYGEARAMLIWNAESDIKPARKVDEEVKSSIRSKVESNPDYYRGAYKSFLHNALGELPTTLSNMTEAFYKSWEETGEIFPKTATEFLSAPSVQSEFDAALSKLSEKFKFPYRVINDPSIKWKGKYLNDGNSRVVVVNVAHADATTAFHEYYHPAVRILRLRNAPLFNSILSQAREQGFNQREEEEAVTEFLSTKAKAKGIDFYLAAFLQYIRRAMGLGKNLTSATKLSEILAVLNEGVDISGENTLAEAYRKLDDLVEKISGSVTDRPVEKRGDYLAVLREQFKNITTSDATNFYQDENGNDVAKRLSAFIGDKELGEFSTRLKNKPLTQSENAARMDFLRAGVSFKDREIKDITETILVEGQEVTFPQLVEAYDKIFASQRVFGKMVHAFFQYMLELDPISKAQAKEQAENYAKQLGDPWIGGIEKHPALRPYIDNFSAIMETAGILIPSEKTIGMPREKFDRISPEVVLTSDLITDSEGKPIGTTADGLVQHENGDFSLIDWKTGNIASDMMNAVLLQYGEDLGIADSKLSRGYLELAFRAIILKEKFPEATFRNIQLVKLDKEGDAHPMKLDLQPYLHVIGNYYKKNKPETYNTLKERGLLEVTNYQGTASSIVKVFDQIKGLPFEDQLSYLRSRLSALMGGKTKEQIDSRPEIKQMVIEYTEAILELEKITGINLQEKTPDLPYLTKGFKNFSDIANPKVQTLHKIIMEAKGNVTTKLQEYQHEHDKLYQKVVSSEVKNKRKIVDALGSASLIFSLATLNPIWFGITIVSHKILSKKLFPSTRDHFAFMWEKAEGNAKGYFLNKKSYYMKDGVQIPLSSEQKAYRDFVFNSMKKEYYNTMHEVVGYKFNNLSKPEYKYEQLGLPSELPDNFMPRVPKPLEEIREEEGFLAGGLGIKTTLGYRAKTFFTSFVEDHFEDKTTPIPLKYYLKSNSPVIESEAHSFNVEAAFKMFMGNLLYKQQMDSAYDIAVGTQNALEEEKDETGNKRYPLLTEWLSDSIFPHILGKTKDAKLMTRKWTWDVGSVMNKVTGIPIGTKLTISQERVLRMMKTSVTFMAMGFKVWGPVRNALMISLSTITKTTQPLWNKILGVPPDGIDDLSIKGASTVFKDFVAKKLQGKEDESKLWTLAKKFDWMPDNHPYRINNEHLLSKSIQLSGTSHAYMFYQMGENFGALWHLAAMLQATKVRNTEGKMVTMWDAYNEKGEWTHGQRGIVDHGNGVTEQLHELTPLEIKTLKRGFEKLQGSYRQEEKTALEATVIGDFLFQFKKYFYQYMKVLFASQYKDMTVGKYVMTGEKPDGMPTYQWHSEVMEGQFTILAGSVMALMSPKTSVKEYLNESPLYNDSTLKGHRKRAMASLVNTGMWFALLMLTFVQFFDGDDDGAFLKRELERTIYDNTRGIAPKDLFQTIQKPVVAAERFANIGTALWSFMTEGVRGEKTPDGWLKGSKTIARATPGINSAMQLNDLFRKHGDGQDQDLFDLIPTR